MASLNQQQQLSQKELNRDDLHELQNVSVPVPTCECERLRLVRETRLLDTTTNEGDYGRFVNLAARLFKAPIALVSLVDTSRAFFKARVGLDASEAHRDVAFCSYVLLESAPEVLIVPDATKDPRFMGNPLVIGEPFIRFYAGTPIILNGVKIGTLCIIDTHPRRNKQFGEKEALMLQDIAAMVTALVREQHRDVMQIQADLAKLAMNVLNGISQPLKALTKEGGDVGQALKVLRSTDGSWDTSMPPADAKVQLQALNRSLSSFSTAVQSMDKALEQNLKTVENLLGEVSSTTDYSKLICPTTTPSLNVTPRIPKPTSSVSTIGFSPTEMLTIASNLVGKFIVASTLAIIGRNKRQSGSHDTSSAVVLPLAT